MMMMMMIKINKYWLLLYSAILCSRADSVRSCGLWFWMSTRLFILTRTHSMHIFGEILPSTEQAVKTQPKQDKSFSFICHCFWPFICCLSVILWLDKGGFLKYFAYCVSVLNKHSFETFVCVYLLCFVCLFCFIRPYRLTLNRCLWSSAFWGQINTN